MTARLNLVVIRTADLERAARFYGVIGLTFTRERHGTGPEHLACEVAAAGLVFEIYPRKAESESSDATRLGFAVPDVDAAVAALLSAGGTPVTEPKDSPWGRRAVVADPDGHRVELTSAP